MDVFSVELSWNASFLSLLSQASVLSSYVPPLLIQAAVQPML